MPTDTVTRVIVHDDYYPYRYPLPSQWRNDLMASDGTKWRVLASIGIAKRHDNDTPLRAWRDAVAEASGIPEGFDPAAGRALDLGFSPAVVRDFVFYLA